METCKLCDMLSCHIYCLQLTHKYFQSQQTFLLVLLGEGPVEPQGFELLLLDWVHLQWLTDLLSSTAGENARGHLIWDINFTQIVHKTNHYCVCVCVCVCPCVLKYCESGGPPTVPTCVLCRTRETANMEYIKNIVLHYMCTN